MPVHSNRIARDSGQVQQDRLAAHEARARERAQKLKDQARGAELYLPWHSSESDDCFGGITVDEVNARSFEVGRKDNRLQTLLVQTSPVHLLSHPHAALTWHCRG